MANAAMVCGDQRSRCTKVISSSRRSSSPCWGAFYLIFPNPSAAFYLLSAMTVALYLVMYLLMYAAAIKLRYS